MSATVFPRLILPLASFALAVPVGGISTAEADSRPVAIQVGHLDEPKEISSLAFSSDGTRLAAVVMLGSEVHVWQLGDKKQIVQRLLIGDISTLFTGESGVLFSPDGKLVAMVESGDRRNNFGMVRVWDAQTGSVIHEIPEDKRNGLRSSIGFFPTAKFCCVLTMARGRIPAMCFLLTILTTGRCNGVWVLHLLLPQKWP